MDSARLEKQVIEILQMNPDYAWVLHLFALLVLTSIASLVVHQLFRFLLRRAKETRTRWDEVFFDAIRKPTLSLVWLLGLFYMADVLVADAKADIFKDFLSLKHVAIVGILAWALLRFVDKGERHFIRLRQSKGKQVDLTATSAVSRLLKICVGVIAALIVLQNLGVSVSGVLAFGGIGGIAVGFAAQDMLSNFFGGLLIYLDKPFRVGDWIRSPDREIEGTIEHIGWRMTTIRTLDKRPLYVPNSVFSKISVENPSRMSHRRIRETIGIRYDDLAVMPLITQQVATAIKADADIDAGEGVVVNFVSFNTSSCDFLVNCFTRKTEVVAFHAVKQRLLLRIAEIIDMNGAEIAYPTQVEYSLARDDAADTARAERRKQALSPA